VDERGFEYPWSDEVKKTLELPNGQLPTLTIDGVVYCQSVAIARHLAEKFGLAGKTDLEKLRADMIVHCVEDALNKIIEILHEGEDPVRRAKLLKKFNDSELAESCGYMEKMLIQNKGGNGYLVGDALTWADLTMYQHITSFVPLVDVDPNYINKFPKLKALVERVGKIPTMAAWLAKRPKTAM